MHRLKSALLSALTLLCAVLMVAQSLLVSDLRAPDDGLARAIAVSRVAGRRSKRERRDRRRRKWGRWRRKRNRNKERRNKKRGGKAYRRRQRAKRQGAQRDRRQARRQEIYAEIDRKREENRANRPKAKYETAEEREERLSAGASAADTPATSTTSNDEAVQAALEFAKSKEVPAPTPEQDSSAAAEVAALEREAAAIEQEEAEVTAAQGDTPSPGSGFYEQDTVLDGSLGTVEQAETDAQAQQERQPQQVDSDDDGRLVKDDDAQAMEDVGGFGGGGDTGPGLIGQENTDPEQFSHEAEAQQEATPEPSDDYNEDDAAGNLGRGFTDEDREVAAGQDFDLDYSDDRDTPSGEDDSQNLGRGFTDEDRAAAEDQDFDLDYSDDRDTPSGEDDSQNLGRGFTDDDREDSRGRPGPTTSTIPMTATRHPAKTTARTSAEDSQTMIARTQRARPTTSTTPTTSRLPM